MEVDSNGNIFPPKILGKNMLSAAKRGLALISKDPTICNDPANERKAFQNVEVDAENIIAKTHPVCFEGVLVEINRTQVIVLNI
jgi:hypothetical protein